jgi:hypothetical protein
MSGDFLKPFSKDQEQIMLFYEKTLKTVRLALPVQTQKIIKFVCDIA